MLQQLSSTKSVHLSPVMATSLEVPDQPAPTQEVPTTQQTKHCRRSLFAVITEQQLATDVCLLLTLHVGDVFTL